MYQSYIFLTLFKYETSLEYLEIILAKNTRRERLEDQLK